MLFVLDILFLIPPALLAVRGYRRGLMRSLLGVGRLIPAVLLTVVLSSPVSRWLDEKILYPPIHATVSTRLSAMAARVDWRVENLYASLPLSLRAHVPEAEAVSDDIGEAIAQWSDTAAQRISGAVAALLATVLIFAAAYFLLSLGLRLLSRILHATPLAGVDRVCGLGVGFLAGGTVAYLTARVLSAALLAIGRYAWVENSVVLRWLGG